VPRKKGGFPSFRTVGQNYRISACLRYLNKCLLRISSFVRTNRLLVPITAISLYRFPMFYKNQSVLKLRIIWFGSSVHVQMVYSRTVPMPCPSQQFCLVTLCLKCLQGIKQQVLFDT
jgi:hypothetical protein